MYFERMFIFVKDSLGTKELIERLIQQETFLRKWDHSTPFGNRPHTPNIAALGAKKRIQGKNVDKGDLSEGDTLANSFMLSRPPRASPSLFNHGYGSPPSSGLHYSSDKAALPSPNQNMTYSKLLKRHAFHTGSENVADGL